MCGIIGYIGNDKAVPKLTKGLSVLEYRGYDSAGVAARIKEDIHLVKCSGRISALEERIERECKESPTLQAACAGIGHTRWATHGGPSDTNAHPHRAGKVVLVHNGIIENYKELKQHYRALGVNFFSQTDTEVAAVHLNAAYQEEGDPVKAIRKACATLKGSYAFAILFQDRPDEIYAVREGSPLILANGKDGSYLASDLTALLPFTKEYLPLEAKEIAILSPNETRVLDGTGVEKELHWKHSTMSHEAAQKNGYAHFMLKEICEQPEALVKSVSPRIKNGLPDFSADGIDDAFWKKIKSIQIVACGSAMHAGIVGSRLLEQIARIPTTVHIASEYRYHPPLAPDGTLLIAISQSGETADTLAAMRYAKAKGLPTLAIVNAVETTIARDADYRVYTYAGPEIAVATTKGYCTQVSVLYMLAAAAARATGRITDPQAAKIAEGLLKKAPPAIERMIAQKERFARVAKKIAGHEHVFYIGRGLDYALSMEAALKLKEISYIQCEAYAAGELKHGTISLIEEGTPVIAISTEAELYDKTESNVREVSSRGAEVIFLCREDAPSPELSADEVICLPTGNDAATLFAAMTAVQLLSYETASCRGCDIDRPRNLAKSVTVE